ncbi:MAG: LEPR-XLL domain-containing protein, partial [Verrucomicrobiales bacterium]
MGASRGIADCHLDLFTLSKNHTRNAFVLEALEPRVLLNAHIPDMESGDGGAIVTEVIEIAEDSRSSIQDQNDLLMGPSMSESINSIFEGLEGSDLDHQEDESDESSADPVAFEEAVSEILEQDLASGVPFGEASGITLNFSTMATTSAITPERPMIFIPGFGGSFAADHALGDWLTTRGLHPDKLQLDPLANTYGDLINTLTSVGYSLGHNLFVANWDWRVAVAPADGTVDGVVSGVSASGLVDETFAYAIDYLGWTLNKAINAWKASHDNAVPTSVDIITHSTGGLVARAYIQSSAYNQSYSAGALPEVNNLFMMGVPNQGVVSTWAFLNDNWAEKPASRILGIVTGLSYEFVVDGGTIAGADGDINLASISTNGTPDKLKFISQYTKSNRDLLATFAFIDSDQNASQAGTLASVNGSADENKLLLDLNHGLGMGDQTPENSDPTAFIDLLAGQLHIIYAADHATPISAELYTGNGTTGSVSGITSPAGRVPANGELYYLPISGSNNGDGTVTTLSSWGMFSNLETLNPARAQKVFGHQIAGGSAALEGSDHSSLVTNQAALEVILLVQGVNDSSNVPFAVTQYGVAQQVAQLLKFGFNYFVHDTRGQAFAIQFLQNTFERVKDLIEHGFPSTETSNGFDIPVISFTPGNININGYLSLQNPTITLVGLNGVGNAHYDKVNGFTGKFILSTNGATFFPGQAYTVSITDSDDQGPEALVGSFEFGTKVFNLQGDQFDLVLGDALKLHASNFVINYDPAGGEGQEVASIDNVTVTSSLFQGFGNTVLNDVKIRTNGFEIGSGILSVSGDEEITVGEFLVARNVNLIFGGEEEGEALVVTFGSTVSVSGSVGLTVGSLELFPNGAYVQSTLTGISASFNLGGANPKGALTLTIASFELALGEALTLSAANVQITPGAEDQIASIASLTISSPQFASLPTITATNFVLRKTGFSISDASLQTEEVPDFGPVLSVGSVRITLTNFAVEYGANVSVKGTIGITATDVVLLPGVGFINKHLGDLSGSYTFNSPAILNLDIPEFDLPIGGVLKITSGSVIQLRPGATGNDPIISIPNATVSTTLLGGLSSATITNLQIKRTGISFQKFVLSPLNGQPVDLGGVISFEDAALTVAGADGVSPFSIDWSGPTTTVTGAISLSAKSASLNAGGALSISVADANGDNVGISATITLGTGDVTLVGETVSLDVAGFVTASAAGIAVEFKSIKENNQIVARQIKVGIEDADIFLGIKGESHPTNSVGLLIDNAELALVIYKNTVSGQSTYALDASAELKLLGFEGILSVSGNAHVRINNTGQAVNEDIYTGVNTTSLSFSAAEGSIQSFSADNLNLTIGTFASVVGNFSFEKTGTLPTDTKIKIGASDVVSSLIAGGVTVSLNSGSLGLVLFGDKTYAIQAEGAISLTGIPSVTLEGTFKLESNTHGAFESPEVITVGGAAITLDYSENFNLFSAKGLKVGVAGAISLEGDFGFYSTGEAGNKTIKLAASNVSARIGAETVYLQLSNAEGGILLLPTGLAAEITGAVSLVGVTGFTFNSQLTLTINKTGSPVVAEGIPTSTDPIVTLDIPESDLIRVTGYVEVAVDNLVELSGNFGFQKSGDDIIVVANQVTVSLELGEVFQATASNGTMAALIKVDGTKAIQFTASGITLDAAGFASVSAGAVSFKTNNTPTSLDYASPDNLLTVGNVSAPLVVANGVTSLSVDAFQFTLGEFVRVKGNFGFRKNLTALEIAASEVEVTLAISGFSAVASEGTLALIINTDGTKVLHVGAEKLSITAGGFANVTASGVAVKYSTSTVDYNTIISVDDVSSALEVEAGLISFSAQGVSIDFEDFIHIEGALGFRKTATAIEIVGADINVSLTVGSAFSAEASNGALALLVNTDGTKALQFSAEGIEVVAAGFSLVSADRVEVAFNTSSVDYSLNPTTLDVDGITAPIEVGLNVTSFSVTGFSFGFSDFVSLSGDFAFRKTTSGTGSQLEVVADNVAVHFGVDGVFTADVSGGSLALIITETGEKTLQVEAATVTVNAAGLANITGSIVTVRYNEQLSDVATTIQIGGVSSDINVSAATNSSDATPVRQPVISFSIDQFAFNLADFVSIEGRFAFRKTGEAIEIAADQVKISLALGSAFSATTTGGTLALRLSSETATSRKIQILEAHATGLVVTAGGFASVTAGAITVKYSNATISTNTSISIDEISAPLNVGANEIAFTADAFTFDLGTFIHVDGNFGFRKTTTSLEITADEVNVSLGIAGVFTASIEGGSLALLIGVDGKKAMHISAAGVTITAGDFANATSGEVTVFYNETITDYSNNPLQLNIDGVTATLAAPANTTAFIIKDLAVDFAGVASVGGSFGFQKTGSVGSEVITATASGAYAKLQVGSFEAGLNGGSLGLQIRADGTKVLEASGSLVIQGGGFGSA